MEHDQTVGRCFKKKIGNVSYRAKTYIFKKPLKNGLIFVKSKKKLFLRFFRHTF